MVSPLVYVANLAWDKGLRGGRCSLWEHACSVCGTSLFRLRNTVEHLFRAVRNLGVDHVLPGLPPIPTLLKHLVRDSVSGQSGEPRVPLGAGQVDEKPLSAQGHERLPQRRMGDRHHRRPPVLAADRKPREGVTGLRPGAPARHEREYASLVLRKTSVAFPSESDRLLYV